METWLFVAPCFDEVTKYTLDEAMDAADYLESKGFKVIRLVKEKAVRENVEKYLRENPELRIAHYDHGSEDKIWGNDKRPVIDLENVDLLQGRICYNDNCSSAKKLGVEAWKRGAIYWGYDDVFYFTTDAAEEFKEFVNSGIKAYADGIKDWKECLRIAKQTAAKLIDKLIKAGKALAAACLRHDRDHLHCWGPEKPGEGQADCLFRKVAIKLFGSDVGWRLGRSFPASVALFFFGLGVLLHDYAHALWQVGGIREILSFQGGYIGAGISVVGFVLAYYQVFSVLKKKGGS